MDSYYMSVPWEPCLGNGAESAQVRTQDNGVWLGRRTSQPGPRVFQRSNTSRTCVNRFLTASGTRRWRVSSAAARRQMRCASAW